MHIFVPVCARGTRINATAVSDQHMLPTSRMSHRDSVAFYEDDGIDQRFRNRLDDFRGSGYDRGHLVRRSGQQCTFNWTQSRA